MRVFASVPKYSDSRTRKSSRTIPVVVSQLCLDLDAKTPAAVKEACENANLPVPKRCHDPNHYVKTAKGKFIEVKKALKIAKCFAPEAQTRLAKEFSQALHQHRTKGDISPFRMAPFSIDL